MPHVLQERKRRLEKAGIELPPNLKEFEADLGQISLADVLGDVRADLVTAEGLTLYFEPEENVQLLNNLGEALKPEGAVVTEIYYKSNIHNLSRNYATGPIMSLFLRQVGSTPGLIKDDDELRQWLNEAGFSEYQSFSAEKLLTPLGEEKPVLDLQTYIIAWNNKQDD